MDSRQNKEYLKFLGVEIGLDFRGKNGQHIRLANSICDFGMLIIISGLIGCHLIN